MIVVQLLNYNSDHSFLKILCQLLLEFSILNFVFFPTAHCIAVEVLLNVFFVFFLFLVTIIIIEKN